MLFSHVSAQAPGENQSLYYFNELILSGGLKVQTLAL